MQGPSVLVFAVFVGQLAVFAYLARAVWVKRRAATVTLSGRSSLVIRLSSVTTDTQTTVGFSFLVLSSRAIFERETGGRLILDCSFVKIHSARGLVRETLCRLSNGEKKVRLTWKRRRRMVLLKRESVRRARKR